MSEYKPIQSKCIKNDDFLLNRFRESIEKIKFIKPPTRNLIEKLRNNIDLHLQTESLAEIWKSLLDDSIAFLKLKDEREKYHDDMTLRTEDLYAFLQEFRENFEPILYGAVPNYRDHLAHVFRVFLLGYYIINNAIGLKNIGPYYKDLEISPEEKEAIWCILTLAHDLGIALEQINKINQSVRGMLQKFGNIPVQELGYSYFTQFGNISEFVVRFLSSDIIEVKEENGRFATHLQAKYYQKFLSAMSNFNHGVISSIILMKDLVYFKESDLMLDSYKPLDAEDARQFLIRREILRAIASHSCEDIYYLGIKNFPFLLTVCDEMQEWGRPRLFDITRRGGTTTDLTINNFDDKVVDYKITFSFPEEWKPTNAEKDNAKDEIKRYFVAKCEKWKSVLRSAVGGQDRDLQLNFTVEDRIPPNVEAYSLKHKNPEECLTYEEDRVVDWKTLKNSIKKRQH